MVKLCLLGGGKHLNEKELKEFVGKRIREERKRRKLTQKELADKVGVAHNTVSSYENGTNAPEQNMIFKIATALDIKVDDLFPSREYHPQEEKFLDRIESLKTANLQLKDMVFLQSLIEKTLSLQGTEREKFLDSIKFTVDYYKKMNDKD